MTNKLTVVELKLQLNYLKWEMDEISRELRRRGYAVDTYQHPVVVKRIPRINYD